MRRPVFMKRLLRRIDMAETDVELIDMLVFRPLDDAACISLLSADLIAGSAACVDGVVS